MHLSKIFGASRSSHSTGINVMLHTDVEAFGCDAQGRFHSGGLGKQHEGAQLIKGGAGKTQIPIF